MTLRSIAAPLTLALSLSAGAAAAADLALTVTGPTQASPGQTLNFVIAISSLNFGLPPDLTTSVVITVQGFSQASASGAGWSCQPAGQNINCTRSALLSTGGAYPDISVTAVAGQGTTYSTCAVVTHNINAATQPDQNLSNNSGCINGALTRGLGRPDQLDRRTNTR